ncbi:MULTISPECIES: hypothetical protein [unclassified Desulfovibrio]|uniref:hypothetical protein n=1 Tax=unclassified Desulfovibrio TaxID=2593640 RepID=UPI000F5E9984|nr:MULTISPECIES: hypothetical protein [unclassified Desulfovibrio]RRD70020.1 hypothetical protein EII24_07880 [Desulfovibrio sp. OH1209_COT-279]RRD86578.1 hypothetical protein EII23_07880 [Desulfovibrio sp. OH1186_COT-070]
MRNGGRRLSNLSGGLLIQKRGEKGKRLAGLWYQYLLLPIMLGVLVSRATAGIKLSIGQCRPRIVEFGKKRYAVFDFGCLQERLSGLMGFLAVRPENVL